MLLFCPRCGEELDIGTEISGVAACPSCGEDLEIDTLRKAICPICGCGFEETESIHICPTCKTPHHEECWTENQGCSTYGCPSAVHLESHTSEGSNTGIGGGSSMIPCPACGAMHPATDLVCAACGKLFRDDLFDVGGVTGPPLLSRLARNFRLLGRDIVAVFRLWWGEFSRYAQFTGKTRRRGYFAFYGVNCVLRFLFLVFFLVRETPQLYLLVELVAFLPELAATVRRLRDTDISPWMILAFPIRPFLVLVPSVDRKQPPLAPRRE